jgi:Family of unknown function (DUF6184)
MHARRGVAAFLLPIAALVACAAHIPTPSAVEPRPGVTSMQKDAGYDAVVERLAAARCDQEQSCGNVGPHVLFASRQACLDELRGNVRDDLQSFDCPLRLDPTRFEACAGAVSVAKCGRPFETLARYRKCHAAATCIK